MAATPSGARISRCPWRDLRAWRRRRADSARRRNLRGAKPVDLGKSSKLRMEKHPGRKSLFHGEFMRAEYGTRVTQFIYRARAFISFLVAFKRIQKSFCEIRIRWK